MATLSHGATLDFVRDRTRKFISKDAQTLTSVFDRCGVKVNSQSAEHRPRCHLLMGKVTNSVGESATALLRAFSSLSQKPRALCGVSDATNPSDSKCSLRPERWQPALCLPSCTLPFFFFLSLSVTASEVIVIQKSHLPGIHRETPFSQECGFGVERWFFLVLLVTFSHVFCVLSRRFSQCWMARVRNDDNP